MRTALFIALLCATALCRAQGNEAGSAPTYASPITDHFDIRGIYFWGHIGTRGRFDSASGVEGTPFTAESDLGETPKTDQPLVEITFRLRDRNRLRVDFIDLSRGATKALDRTLIYGDDTYVATDVVQSEVDWRQTDFTYTYSFLRNQRVELGAGLGVHLIQAEANAAVPAKDESEQFSGAGPFATLALDGTWNVWQALSLNGRAQYLKLNVSSLSGALGIYHADLQYRWRPNFAFGAGFDDELVQLAVRKRDPSGIVDMNLHGPEVFLRVSF
jgi:hypothetical protein